MPATKTPVSEKRKKMLRYLWASGKAQRYLENMPGLRCTLCQSKVQYVVAKKQLSTKMAGAPKCVKCIKYN